MATSSQLQLRRGTAAQVAAFTGAAGEVTPDMTNNRLVLHDGTTVGGHPVASEAYVDAAVTGGVTPIYISVTNAPYNATGDGTTDDTAAIQAAVDAAGANTVVGGVFIPRGAYKITSAIAVPAHVSIFGEPGDGTHILPDGCSAFTYNYTAGFGNAFLQHLYISGTNCTSQIAIYNAGTLNEADVIYGLTIDNVKVYNYNTAVQFRAIQNFQISNCWFQNVNSGVNLIGKCYVVRMFNVKIIKADGCGTGTEYGLLCDSFDFTSGSGVLRPETVLVTGCTFFGHDTAIYFSQIIYGAARDCDINADVEGILIGTALSVLDVGSNYIQVAGASASAAIRVRPQTAVIDSKVNIHGNRIESANSPPVGTTTGVLVSLATFANADNVSIKDNTFNGNTLNDIAVYASGHIQIVGNRCRSSGLTNSIFTSAIPTGRPVYIATNNCAGAIAYDAADERSGKVILGPNVTGGTTFSWGRGGWVDVAYSAGNFTAGGSMTWTVESGDQSTFMYRIDGNSMTVAFHIQTSTVGGTADATLRVAIPGGYTAVNRVTAGAGAFLDNGVPTTGYLDVAAGGTYIQCKRSDFANWKVTTNGAYVSGEITFKV